MGVQHIATSRVRAALCRLGVTTVAVLGSAVLTAPAVEARSGTQAGRAVNTATLYVRYTMQCTFTIVDEAGQTLTVIPPGRYQLEVSTPMMFKLAVPGGIGVDTFTPGDYYGCRGWVQFEMNGPGVNYSTNLDFGCDSTLILSPAAFPPSSTFTAFDLNQPGATRFTFRTAADGTPLQGTSPYTTGPTGTRIDSSIFASLKSHLVGTVNGTVSSAGKLALVYKGKPVSTLKPGRYRFTVVDKSTSTGVTIKGAATKLRTLTDAKFVGKHSEFVTLTKGQWQLGNGASFTVAR